MKLHWRLSGLGFFICVSLSLAALCFSGCAAPEGPTFSSAPSPTTAPTRSTQPGGKPDVFNVGDQVIVTFSDPALQRHEERIKEDGTITLYLIGPVKAAGKTSGELQKDIQDLYVEKGIYQANRMTAIVTSPERVYYVGGEVRRPDRYVYSGATTVTKAIQAAGDFTDYAKKAGIILFRADGRTKIKVNWKKVIKHPETDPLVYPGDKIVVPRSWW